MSWFSDALHFVTDPLANLFSGPKIDPGLQSSIDQQTQLLKTSTAAAQAASDQALKAQQDANLIAQSASVPLADSESVRSAADDQRRKLLGGTSFGIGLADTYGAAPTGFRALSGS